MGEKGGCGEKGVLNLEWGMTGQIKEEWCDISFLGG